MLRTAAVLQFATFFSSRRRPALLALDWASGTLAEFLRKCCVPHQQIATVQQGDTLFRTCPAVPD